MFLEAARAKEAKVYTSSITVAECTFVMNEKQGNFTKVLTPEVKRLLDGMLTSSKSGINPVMPAFTITKLSRDLRWVHGCNFDAMDAIHIATVLTMKCK